MNFSKIEDSLPVSLTKNISINFNPFIPNGPFLYPLKTSENRNVF